MKMKSSQMFFVVELFILVFYVHEHICSEVFLRLNVRHHVTSQRKPNTAKHTSQQQTIRTDHHPGHSHPMAKGQKKRSANYDGNMGDKSCKRLSAEGNNDKNKDTGTNEAPGDGECLTATDGRDMSSTKDDGATTPHDCDAETNLQKDADTHSSAEGDDDKRLNVYLINYRSKPSGHSGSTPADIAFVFLFQHSTGIRQPQRSHAIPETDIALEPPARTNHGHLAVLKRL